VLDRHRPPYPWGLDLLGRGPESRFGRGQTGEVEPDILSMWQCDRYRSCSNGGVRSDSTTGLPYCSRS